MYVILSELMKLTLYNTLYMFRYDTVEVENGFVKPDSRTKCTKDFTWKQSSTMVVADVEM